MIGFIGTLVDTRADKLFEAIKDLRLLDCASYRECSREDEIARLEKRREICLNIAREAKSFVEFIDLIDKLSETEANILRKADK